MDGISFSASAENPGTRYDVNIKNADDVFEFFTGIFLTIIGKLASLFWYKEKNWHTYKNIPSQTIATGYLLNFNHGEELNEYQEIS